MATPIRVFVQWKESTVFAGEDIECTITFKNVTAVPGAEKSPSRHNGFPPGVDRKRSVPAPPTSSRPAFSRNTSLDPQASSNQGRARGHRPTLSLNTPSVHGPISAGRPSPLAGQQTPISPPHKHGRSLSIISIGTDTGGKAGLHGGGLGPSRPARGHGRSASLQVVPRRGAGHGFSASAGHRSTTQPSPLIGGPSPQASQSEFPIPIRSSRRQSGHSASPNTPTLGPRANRKPSNSFSQNFKFPAAPPPNKTPSPEPTQIPDPAPSPRVAQLRSHSPRPPEDPPGGRLTPPDSALSPIARILSGSSMNGTPRSSGEFYSMSNNSTETLVSEYQAQPSARLLPGSSRFPHSRQSSRLTPVSRQNVPETLMMGYAQVMGSFTLDGSLVNQAPFEEVKRKGVVGGQGGGGVVGVERTKRESGLFGALGWGNIGESLGGLIGGGELSSIKEMRGIANAKTVPLISTPQSILFVDLRLAPGESRSFKYTFTLPRGLPPTHKGRTIKVNYHLTIGTQRPSSAKGQQQVKQVDVPFRVFGSVSSQGEILGHDLMSPYIILRDEAKTVSIEPRTPTMNSKAKASDSNARENLSDFLSYVDKLLSKPRQNSSLGLLSPTESLPGDARRNSSFGDGPKTMKEAIDLAILRSNISQGSNTSANRFEIARSGRRVAVIMLTRPSYRLGETIHIIIDFEDASIPCYGVNVCLQTTEKVDPAISLRSAASIQRVTRKIHASFSENALFAKRIAFAPTIPPNATPEFVTSGISLEWKLRVEFMTPRLSANQVDDQGNEYAGVAGGEGELLEEVEKDDRGVVLAAVERLLVESFEVAVPVRVYGAAFAGLDGNKDDEDGLVI